MAKPTPIGSTASQAIQNARDGVDERCVELVDVPYRKRRQPQLARIGGQVPAPLWAAIHRCVTRRAPWPLFIHGPVGTGKTRACLLLHDQKGGIWLDFSEMVDTMAMAKRGELCDLSQTLSPFVSKKECLQQWADAPLVIIDEIGLKRPNEFAVETLTEMLNCRECKPLILVSNLTIGELDSVEIDGRRVEMFSDRVASRMQAGTVCHVLGDDRRVRK